MGPAMVPHVTLPMHMQSVLAIPFKVIQATSKGIASPDTADYRIGRVASGCLIEACNARRL